MPDVIREYAQLALRVDRLVAEDPQGAWVCDYRGPAEWREAVAAEPMPVGAVKTVARRLAGERLPLTELVRGCMGLEVGWLSEDRFDEAYALLDHGLPKGPGSLARRLHTWQDAHSLPPDRADRVHAPARKAIDETRARTDALVPLPRDDAVDCVLRPGTGYLALGHHPGGTKGTIYINSTLPFNLADLLYVVAHEGYPGHICEQMLKEIHLADRPEAQVRIMPSPAYVLSEGLGLRAQEIIFPGDQAQRWLIDNVGELGDDGSDYAKIHRAKNILWGVWCNAAFLAENDPGLERSLEYLGRWALLRDSELAEIAKYFHRPFTEPYIFAYYHGWRLLEPWLGDPASIRWFLTEQAPVERLTRIGPRPAR